MKVVLDTNTIISGLFWRSNPHRILELIREQQLTGYTSQALLDELLDVLRRPKFSTKLTSIGTTPQEIVEDIEALLVSIQVVTVEPVIVTDSDDDEVLACAKTAGADCIVSGDRDLLGLQIYEGIPILSATELLSRWNNRSFH